jgi:hypothetical protein
MDKNKLEKLRSIGYTIAPCCYLCKHSHFPNAHTEWGTCTRHEFVFLPLSGTTRQMTVIKYGKCGEFETADGIGDGLGKYAEFFNDKK